MISAIYRPAGAFPIWIRLVGFEGRRSRVIGDAVLRSARGRLAGGQPPVSGLLSRAGVERAAVWAVAGLRVMNLAQACLSLYFARTISRGPFLGVAAVAALTASGVLVVWSGIRAGRLVGWSVTVDLAVGLALLLVAPWFQPRPGDEPWTDWPIGITFLVGAEAAVCFPPGRAALSVLLLIAGSMSWLLRDLPAESHSMIVRSSVAYVGFAAVTGLFLLYLRRLASLADSRAEEIRQLEEERTRRVLHTPYRLLNDLAKMLRQETARDGGDPQRRARLAEAVASVHEVESIVRGTEPASSQLANELLRLREQFVDLPLVVDVEDVDVDLPPAAVYRIREAVRSALQNVRLHAEAGEVVVYASADRATWLVSVHDDGQGFDPRGRVGVGLGELILNAMREIGATARIDSAPGQGTLVELTGGYA